MSPSPDSERRETPLAAKLKDRIRRNGPISVADYMQACLHDPEYGYYRGKPAIGASGDFITAPEISQTFGELLGLWSAVVWQQMGQPAALDLVELGPGRGTLMRDALRAARIVPGFGDALRVHLIESNETLIAAQRDLLAPIAQPRWHASLEAFSESGASDGAPAIILGNEFLDTYPAAQHVMRGGRLRQRGVGLDETGELAFTLLGDESPAPEALALSDGDVIETQDFGFARDIVRLAGRLPLLAALLIDYGHVETQAGETLQAVREHKAEHPLASPGEADLTVQVDFAAFRRAVEEATRGGSDAARLGFSGPITQAEFLGRLGVMERTSRLMAANPAKALAIETGVARLMAPSGMGSRFKVIGLAGPALLPLPGFG